MVIIVAFCYLLDILTEPREVNIDEMFSSVNNPHSAVNTNTQRPQQERSAQSRKDDSIIALDS